MGHSSGFQFFDSPWRYFFPLPSAGRRMTRFASMFRSSGRPFGPHRIASLAGLRSASPNAARSSRNGSITTTGFAALAVFGLVVCLR